MTRLVLALVLACCVGPHRMGAEASPPLRIVALQTILTEIAREVGGNHVTVAGIIPPGVDPHAYDPSAADMRKVADADLVLASGLGLESYLDRLAARRPGSNRVLLVGDALPGILRGNFTAGAERGNPAQSSSNVSGEPDPHWWHSIDNMIFATNLVRAGFSRLRPAEADDYARNAAAYIQRLQSLKVWVAAELAVLPPSRRHLVTSHDAFGYFARDYHFTLDAISGFSTDSETNAAHLARLIDTIRREHIKAIFPEDSVNPRIIESLLRETQAARGGILYADGLGGPKTDATTYDGMYRHNIRTIVDALR